VSRVPGDDACSVGAGDMLLAPISRWSALAAPPLHCKEEERRRGQWKRLHACYKCHDLETGALAECTYASGLPPAAPRKCSPLLPCRRARRGGAAHSRTDWRTCGTHLCRRRVPCSAEMLTIAALLTAAPHGPWVAPPGEAVLLAGSGQTHHFK